MWRYFDGWNRAERYARLVGQRVEDAFVSHGIDHQHLCPDLQESLDHELPLTVAQLQTVEEILGEDASRWLLRAG